MPTPIVILANPGTIFSPTGEMHVDEWPSHSLTFSTGFACDCAGQWRVQNAKQSQMNRISSRSQAEEGESRGYLHLSNDYGDGVA